MEPSNPDWRASPAGPPGLRPHETESPRVLLISGDEGERARIRALLQESARAGLPLGDVSLDCAGDLRQAAVMAADIDYIAVLLGHGTLAQNPGQDSGAAAGGGLIERLRRSGELPEPYLVLAPEIDGAQARGLMAAGAADVLSRDELTASLLERALRYALSLHRAETRAAGLELFDAESGLARQPLLWEMLSLAVRRAKRNKDFLAVLLVHLDCIERPTGRQGVDPFSAVVPLVSRRLVRSLRACDTIARLDDGHLAIMVEAMPRAEDIQTVAEKVITTIAGHYELDGRHFDLAINVGIALYPTSAADAATLLRSAAAATLAAREKGPNGFHFG